MHVKHVNVGYRQRQLLAYLVEQERASRLVNGLVEYLKAIGVTPLQGPKASNYYGLVRALHQRKFLRTVRVPGFQWKRIELTELGRKWGVRALEDSDVHKPWRMKAA